MSDLNINNITDRTGDSGPVIAGVSTVSSTGAFTVPVGPTETVSYTHLTLPTTPYV